MPMKRDLTWLKKRIVLCSALLFGVTANAQSLSTRFFKDQELKKEVPASKARYSQTVSNETDGRVTTEIRDIIKNELIMRETYKGDEPFGVWFYGNGETDIFLDYEFEMVYSDKKFEENELSKKLQDFFTDNDSLGYKAPVIASGEKSISRFVINNMFFPVRAREEGIQGKVFLGFKISEDASVGEYLVYKGTNKLLDKEAMRVIRKLRVSSPPMVRGEARAFRLMLPISFKIE